MKIEIYQIKDQAKGNFNNGEILENKPIGFPGENGKLKPYSNIFYWAHAWTTNEKSTIGLHPHKGFEICSFVLKGKINFKSYDKIMVIKEGSGVRISKKTFHQSINISNSDTIIMEIETPNIKRDLIRFKDNYGRG